MGDRNNPIKFGPEWLRNLARERNAGGPASGGQAGAGPGAGSGAGQTASAHAATGAAAHTMPKVLLAKLRYGREEMLALYDRSAEAPPELIYNDALYQPRGKPPIALNNNFEDEVREPVRSGPPLGGLSPGDRFGVGRGLGRGSTVEVRGRGRLPFVRQPSVGSKRPGTSTNWRQSRDEDEWRASDSGRPRSLQPDKWDREWGDRPAQDKSQSSWSANRRTWVGGDEDNLPEWAVDNAEACGGTFDSSGAFHGYSNDDTNLPKQDAPYQLTRSHTHGSFARSKTAEEGSEEWWASEKAKKLSPKRFDAIEIKFKKPTSTIPDDGNSSSSGGSGAKTTSKESQLDQPSKRDKHEEPPLPTYVQEQAESSSNLDDFNKKAVRFAESKTFDALMRSDINLVDSSDERGNFQSVMITPNNSLRQKHQNIVAHQNYAPPANAPAARNNRKSGILQILQKSTKANEGSQSGQHQSQENKVVEELMELTLDEMKERDLKDMLKERDMKELLAKERDMQEMLAKERDMKELLAKERDMKEMLAKERDMKEMLAKERDMKELLAKRPQTGDGLLSNPPTSSNSVLTSRSQHRMSPVLGLASKEMMTMTSSSGMPGMHSQSLGTPGMHSQPLGSTNCALNASLGLPAGGADGPGRPAGMPLAGVPPPVLPGPGLMPPRPTHNLNTSLFLNQTGNNAQAPPPSELPNMGGQGMFPLHGLQQSSSQSAFGSSIYSNVMQQPLPPATTPQELADQWYYEDPKKNIQGPFSSRDMYNWYQAGFFTPSLMVRRATDAVMRPLGSYGPAVPFAQMDMLSSFPMSFEARNHRPHESILNAQQGMGLDVMNMTNMGVQQSNPMESMQFGAVGLMRNPSFGQQQMDSLWSQPAPAPAPNMMWMPQNVASRNETRVNNLPMFFWDQQPSAMSNTLRPEVIPKEMKTEDEILAQLRASQNNATPQNMLFMNNMSKPPPPITPKEDSFPTNLNMTNMTPNLDELEKLMQEKPPVFAHTMAKNHDPQLLPNMELKDILHPVNFDHPPPPIVQPKEPVEAKVTKQPKADNEISKVKDNSGTKSKSAKKSKDDKKEDTTDAKTKEDDNMKTEKRSSELSPAKPKKEEKINKKELEREKKEWLKEGFTIVKSQDKAATKENKKRNEEIKIAEEIERRRKVEERQAPEDKTLKTLESYRKQQEAQKEQQRQQSAESVSRRAPWSAVANQSLTDTAKERLTLAEIQRLERENKLVQMKEQQQMIQMIAQQQAASLAREQEMQASVGWAKKKRNGNMTGHSLAEIQAEARKQSLAVAAAAAQAQEEAPAAAPAHAPWASSSNGAVGFWDAQFGAAPEPPVEPAKPKKKAPAALPAKKEPSPAADFESWCMTVLTSWNTKIDVPTFVGFLKDIESPYEVKDYVKCYLGESRDSSDFARQFLERRSKLLRVGMVTPSDDLCSPAVAINPRSNSGSDYQEVKGKGKKTKKNKMLKVDARILGFSVTAAEDRINVGDIDTA